MNGLDNTSQIVPSVPNPQQTVRQSESNSTSGTTQATYNSAGQPERNTEAKRTEVRDVVDQLEKLADRLDFKDNTKLSISYHEDSERFVYRGIDRNTGEVVTEYPSDEVLEMISKFREIAGLALDLET